jgi:hypothetical protein
VEFTEAEVAMAAYFVVEINVTDAAVGDHVIPSSSFLHRPMKSLPVARG